MSGVPKAEANAGPWAARSSFRTTWANDSCISTGLVTGISTCSRNDAERPSQKNEVCHARFASGIVLRVPAVPSAPTLDRRPGSVNAAVAWWHEAHDCVPLTESDVSWKSRRPSATPSSVSGLSVGSEGRGNVRDTFSRYGVAPAATTLVPGAAAGATGAAAETSSARNARATFSPNFTASRSPMREWVDPAPSAIRMGCGAAKIFATSSVSRRSRSAPPSARSGTSTSIANASVARWYE